MTKIICHSVVALHGARVPPPVLQMTEHLSGSVSRETANKKKLAKLYALSDHHENARKNDQLYCRKYSQNSGIWHDKKNPALGVGRGPHCDIRYDPTDEFDIILISESQFNFLFNFLLSGFLFVNNKHLCFFSDESGHTILS